MQRNINSLIGFSMGATDGEIGRVKEFYFDDKTWKIRYLIVKTGNWLSGIEVLISPGAILKNSLMQETFPVDLTKEQIRSSPDIDTNKPVSRQQEIELHGHYPWQPYWGSGFYAGGLWDTANASLITEEKTINDADNKGQTADEDPHLRSTKEVTGYNIHANDGEVGYLKDFIIDDQTWQILCLVVDTHDWFVGKKVLIEVGHIKEIQWDKSKIFINMNVDAIKDSEAYKELEFINPELNSSL